MANRTIWILLGLSTAGLAAFGVNREPSANAATQSEDPPVVQELGAQPDAGERAGSADSGAPSAASNEACPMTAQAKLNMVLRELHALNQGEIESGRLAEQRAQSGDVKEFAKTMVRDHSEADRKLTDYAKRNGIDLTKVTPVDPIHAALDSADKASENALRTKKGADFDVAYAAPQTLEHRVALGVVEEGQKVAKGEARALMDETQQMLSRHLSLAEKLEGNLRYQPAAIGGGPGQKGDSDAGGAAPEWHGDGGEGTSTDAGAPPRE